MTLRVIGFLQSASPARLAGRFSESIRCPLDILRRSDADRAALIGRLHRRQEAEWLAELLIDLEEDEPARLRLVGAQEGGSGQ
jgi:hypothetical protein